MTNQTNPLLTDTTLCAIVRDEMLNPAQLPGKSGIRSFVETHAPLVERAIIIDTGSIDGTRQELEQLEAEFPNLKVKDRKFNGYDRSRNASIRKVQTKYILVLDVDELLTLKQARRLAEAQGANPLAMDSKPAFYFDLMQVSKGGSVYDMTNHNARCFLNHPKLKYISLGGLWELLQINWSAISSARSVHLDPELRIYHFASGVDHGNQIKKEEWYNGGYKRGKSPANMPHFKDWKAPNRFRIKYK